MTRQPADPLLQEMVGHVVPGLSALAISLWWLSNVLSHFYATQRLGKQFRSNLWYPARGDWCSRIKGFNIETSLKMMITGSSMLSFTFRLITEHDKDLLHKMNHATHFTMSSAYFIYFTMEYLKSRGFSAGLDCDYWGGSLALGIHGMMVYFHLHGKDMLNVRMHVLLSLILAAAAVSYLVEMCNRNSVQACLARCFFFLLMATWLIHIGLILNDLPGPGYWDGDSHSDVMLLTLYFTWHCLVDFGVLVVIASCAQRKVNAKDHFTIGNGHVTAPLLPSKEQNGMHKVILD